MGQNISTSRNLCKSASFTQIAIYGLLPSFLQSSMALWCFLSTRHAVSKRIHSFLTWLCALSHHYMLQHQNLEISIAQCKITSILEQT